MALIIKDSINIDTSKVRVFDSYTDYPDRADNWTFKYITLDKYMQDQYLTGLDENWNKNEYPVGTIFFDSTNYGLITLTSSIKNIIIDNTPPKILKENIDYIAINSWHNCEIYIESDTPLDIQQLSISCANDILYQVLRKTNKVIPSDYIRNITMTKSGITYKLTFEISPEYSTKKLNENQIDIAVWDLAGNICIYKTGALANKTPPKGGQDLNDYTEWKYIDDTEPLDALQRLKILFTEVNPGNLVIEENIPGKVLVKVANPNFKYLTICPTVTLGENSIGYIEKSSFIFDPNTGVLQFYVININTPGELIVDAWLTLSNSDIINNVISKTFADEKLPGWIFSEKCRLYNFKQYVPNYLKNSDYYDFVMLTEKFMNTCEKSLSTNGNISILEKIARINNFNDITSIENNLINEYISEYGIEITPNLESYIYFLNNKPEKYNNETI